MHSVAKIAIISLYLGNDKRLRNSYAIYRVMPYFNDLEWSLTQISMARRYSTLNITETAEDRDSATTEY